MGQVTGQRPYRPSTRVPGSRPVQPRSFCTRMTVLFRTTLGHDPTFDLFPVSSTENRQNRSFSGSSDVDILTIVCSSFEDQRPF
jgi:hypothetical protein